MFASRGVPVFSSGTTRRVQLLAMAAFAAALSLFSIGCRREIPAGLSIINGAEPESLDPALISAQPDTRLVLALFAGLTRNDPKTGAAIPDMASHWEISTDGRLYTFHLRPNLRWSNGSLLTADDFVYSWRRALAPATAATYAAQLFYIEGAERYSSGENKDPSSVAIRALDPQTLQVHLVHPTAFFLDLCANQIYSVVPPREIERYGDRWIKQSPVPCSGPYQLEYWRINDKVRLRKNPFYWDAANTHTDVIDIYPVGSDKAALNLYESGQIDIVWDKELVPVELIDLLLQRPDFHRFDYLGTYFIRFNTQHKPFDDPRVRRALSLAIDKKRIVERITRGGESPAGSLTPRGIPGYTPPEGLAYNPELARKLLAAAGYPGGRGFPAFHYLYNAAAGGGAKTHEKIAVELKEMWRQELGLTLELQKMESKVFWAAVNALDYDVCRSSWVGDYNDPNTFLDMFISNSGNNRTGWKSPAYDQLLDNANSDPHASSRMATLHQAEHLLVEDEMPIAPLFFYSGINYFDASSIHGIHNNILDVHPLNAIEKITSRPPLTAARP